jgi:putative ABC transport system ATP-binding protein
MGSAYGSSAWKEAAEMPPIVEIDDVTRIYRKGGTEIRSLNHVTLRIEAGEFVALMGPSGSGKTTLLNLLAGLDSPSSGAVRVCGLDLAKLSSRELARWRADHVGFVFQSFNLLPVLTARQNVELPLTLQPLSREARRAHAEAALRCVGLGDRMDHRPSELSGGQEQRVAIARALACDPQLLVADEPTGDLDATAAHDVLLLMERLNREFGKTIIIVTHDPHVAEFAQRELHLEKGVLQMERRR